MSNSRRKNRLWGEGEFYVGHVYKELPPREDAQIYLNM